MFADPFDLRRYDVPVGELRNGEFFLGSQCPGIGQDVFAYEIMLGDACHYFSGRSTGFDVDMNVIAGGGLVGIVTKTGPDWAQVRSIIDDMSNVSAMILKNSDLCYVRGDLQMMTEGTMHLNELRDLDDEVEQGDKVVTSYASAKYHKGILIGYVNEIKTDANNLTKSGSLTPAVDFEHLSTVLVITDLKQQVDTEKADPEEAAEEGEEAE